MEAFETAAEANLVDALRERAQPVGRGCNGPRLRTRLARQFVTRALIARARHQAMVVA
jgi:hypothetical protein